MPDVIMPKMGDGMEAGTLLSWKKQDGEEVKEGDIIAEIATDKSNVEIEAEESGVFKPQVAEGDSVPVGAVIAVIGDGGGAAVAAQPASSMPKNGSNGSNGSTADGQQEFGARPDVPQAGSSDVMKAETEDDTHAVASAKHEPYTGTTTTMSYRDAIRQALIEELDTDPSVFLLGEEIGQYQGTFKITAGFLQKYGAERIVDTPISEAAMIGMTVGAAMLGLASGAGVHDVQLRAGGL